MRLQDGRALAVIRGTSAGRATVIAAKSGRPEESGLIPTGQQAEPVTAMS